MQILVFQLNEKSKIALVFLFILFQVHADIKPDNLILVNNMLKITDLSLAFQLPSPRQFIQRPIIRGTTGRHI